MDEDVAAERRAAGAPVSDPGRDHPALGCVDLTSTYHLEAAADLIAAARWEEAAVTLRMAAACLSLQSRRLTNNRLEAALQTIGAECAARCVGASGAKLAARTGRASACMCSRLPYLTAA